MSAEHAETEWEIYGPSHWTVEGAVLGLPTTPVVVRPLDSSVATLIGGSGRGWNGAATGTPVLVPYSFATRDSSYYTSYGAPIGNGFQADSEAFDSAQRASVLEALKLWEQVSGLTFIEVPDAPQRWAGGIRFLLEDLPMSFFTTTLGQAVSFRPYGVEVTLQRRLYADNPMRPGSEAFDVLLHEIGHAIGLKHPFEGSPVLPSVHDHTANTVMSYTGSRNLGHLGPLDIAAAQHLYGTQEAEDTLAVRWSRGPGGALVSTGNDAANIITGLDIRDVVRAGGGNDYIDAMGGQDDIVPGNGADTVIGGPGFDTVWAEAPRRHAALADTAGWKELALPNGTDRLSGVEAVRFYDGQVAFHADLAAGQVFRLYGAALGRKPDAASFGEWVQALDTGATSLRAVAANFVGSGEFAARYGSLDNAGFVTLLYQNVLGRAPDAPGLNFWLNAMAAGTSRADTLLGLSESAEHKQRTAAAYQAGLWVADPEAVDVMRAYVAVLDRLPDVGGLANWAGAREAGLKQFDLVERFVSSAEFQARFGGLSNRDFVEQLYRTALDRPTDPGEAAAWTHVLDAGLDSRAGVALGFAASAEMTAKITPLVADGFIFS